MPYLCSIGKRKILQVFQNFPDLNLAITHFYQFGIFFTPFCSYNYQIVVDFIASFRRLIKDIDNSTGRHMEQYP